MLFSRPFRERLEGAAPMAMLLTQRIACYPVSRHPVEARGLKILQRLDSRLPGNDVMGFLPGLKSLKSTALSPHGAGRRHPAMHYLIFKRLYQVASDPGTGKAGVKKSPLPSQGNHRHGRGFQGSSHARMRRDSRRSVSRGASSPSCPRVFCKAFSASWAL